MNPVNMVPIRAEIVATIIVLATSLLFIFTKLSKNTGIKPMEYNENTLDLS